LNEQSGRDTECGGRDEDSVERCEGRESDRAIAGEDTDVRVSEGGEKVTSALRQGCVALNGEYLSGKLREQSGDVAGTGAYFENHVSGPELEGLEHKGNDVRLRYSLPVADGKRMIFVGLGAVRFRDKFVAWDATHGIEDARVRNSTATELGVDHILTSSGRVGHER
jgi:hypothetical protein